MKFLYLLLFIYSNHWLCAQIDYHDVKGKMTMERFAPIHKSRNTIGYVSVANFSQRNEKTKSIHVLNLKADEVFSIVLRDKKSEYYFVESAFNGNIYAFLFLDVASSHLLISLYDVNGNHINDNIHKLRKADLEYFLTHVTHNNNYTGQNQFLHEIGIHGFIFMLNSVEVNLNTCQIFKIQGDTSKEQFYTYMTESPIYEANFLGHSQSQIYFSFEIKGKLDGQYFTETIAIDKSNLNLKYEVHQNADQDYFFFPKIALTKMNSDEVKLVGYFFDAERDMDKGFYDGFALWELQKTGDFINEKYLSFNKDIHDLKFKQDNRDKDLGYLFLQNVFSDTSHNIYIVSEGYQKVAEGITMGVSVMGMGTMNEYTRLKTYDITLSKFDGKFNYLGTQIIEKQRNTLQLAYRYQQPIFEVGKLYNRYGLFDYLGTEITDSSFHIFFKNYKLESLSGGNYKVGRYSELSNGRMFYDNLEKLPNTSETYILPNIGGRVLFAERIKKTIYFEFKK